MIPETHDGRMQDLQEAIILAGGLGTRLRSEVRDVPKSMALINDRPFTEYLLDHLISEGITRIIFSVGHQSESIRDHFSDQYRNCEITYAPEETLLGTGGAIKNAMQHVAGPDVIVVNGDSIHFADLGSQFETHRKTGADVTLALKPMRNFERFGTVEVNQEGRIIRFNEKQPVKEGLINTGTYIFNVSAFQALELPEKFSIEKEFFETHVDQMNLVGFYSDAYFLDIGIPSDFRRAQYEIGVFPGINASWTLFLDRDGVINEKRDDDYVKSLDELTLLPGAIQAIADLSQIFGRVIVVTNQQGVGKHLMTTESLTEIHDHIIRLVEKRGGCIDAIYYTPHLASSPSNMRKPQIGMAIQAKEDFKEIDFSRSIMIGDAPSDMEFGKNANMMTVLITGDHEQQHEYSVASLAEFSNILQAVKNQRL